MGEQKEERERLIRRLEGFEFEISNEALKKNILECDDKFIEAFNKFLDTWFWKEQKQMKEIKRPNSEDLQDLN